MGKISALDFRTDDSEPVRRWRSETSKAIDTADINSEPFVGRIAGNQLHAISQSDPDYARLRETKPDAVQSPKWSGILSLAPFKDVHLWRNACLEGVGLCVWVFMAGLISHGLADLASATALGTVLPVAIAAVMQFMFVSLFIFSLGPVTGAHLTPLLSFATFLAKLTSLPRMVLYIIFQCIGAVIGAYLLRAALGGDPASLIYSPGCYVDSIKITATQTFALEVMGSLFVLFLAFGLGLDPRNKGSFQQLRPFLLALHLLLHCLQVGLQDRAILDFHAILPAVLVLCRHLIVSHITGSTGWQISLPALCTPSSTTQFHHSATNASRTSHVNQD